MERKIEQKLLNWSKKAGKKPLVLRGARQIGKTYAVKQFGEKHFKELIVINFESNKELSSYFNDNLDPRYIISRIELFFQQKIVPADTLIFLDEIQANDRALTALKYFYENAPEYNIIAAGSLLGLAMNRKNNSFPVGKVEILDMFPMDFEEFLWATNNQMLAEEIRRCYETNTRNGSHNLAMELYKQFLVVGGMPESVAKYIETKSFIDAAEAQDGIINTYIADMAKYADHDETARIMATFNSIPTQLAKQNHKFQYKVVAQGGSSTMFGGSINWLELASIVIKCTKLSQIKSPTRAFLDLPSFKLYMNDVGLLTRQAGTLVQGILGDDNLAPDFVGALAENYVATALKSSGYDINYWTSADTAEIDFIITDKSGKIVPIEVKAGKNTKSRSLAVYKQQNKPAYSIRVSGKNFGFENDVKSVPLYAVFCV
jgi:predicted AAA+ superfamily ATPase